MPMVMDIDTGKLIDGNDAINQIVNMAVWVRRGTRPGRPEYGTDLYEQSVSGRVDEGLLAQQVRARINAVPGLECDEAVVQHTGTDLIVNVTVSEKPV